MVNITDNGNSVKFTFTESQYYLFGDGDIEVSKNSLSLVIDESDMITFKKAASNDLFISVPIDETNFSTKQDVIDFFKNYIVDSGGSPDAFVSADFDNQTKHINFYNAEQDLVDYIDATDFIYAGMIDNIKVENGYLVIDFNTASGKQDIYIPLTSFFDASQYYTKSEVDNTFLTKAVFDIKEEVISDALNQLDEDKVNASDLATVATSGSYNDLSDKPSIPAAQVQANWNESDSSSMAYIQNKPSIPAAQVNSDWNANSGVAQILNKPNMADYMTVLAYNPKEQAIAEALTELHETIGDINTILSGI